MEEFEKKIELSDKELEQVIFLSFMFSQGGTELQRAFLNALTAEIGNQDEQRVTIAFMNMVDKLSPSDKPKSTLVTAKIHSDLDSINLAAAEEYSTMQPLIKDDEPVHEPISYIAEEMWNRDHLYICVQEGRSNRKEEFKENTIQDPFFSFGVEYIEREQSSGNRYFDLVLEKVRDVPRDSVLRREEVIKKYNQTHPDTPLAL